MALRSFFASEAETSLAAMREAAASEPPAMEWLARSARVLRGASLLAAETRVYGVATALAASLDEGPHGPPEVLRQRLAATIADLEVLIAGEESDSGLEARARAAEDRWGGPRASLPGSDADRRDAEAFAAREAAAIAGTMEDAVAAFQADPSDRRWLETVLRRQRALLGSVHVDAMPLVGESMRAIEDLTALLIRLDVPVKGEWLDIYRAGRDVLRSVHEALVRGEEPGPLPALSRLRTLRDELMTRYAVPGGEPGIPPEAGEAGTAVEAAAPPAPRELRPDLPSGAESAPA